MTILTSEDFEAMSRIIGGGSDTYRFNPEGFSADTLREVIERHRQAEREAIAVAIEAACEGRDRWGMCSQCSRAVAIALSGGIQ